jgi:hypothetical protein
VLDWDVTENGTLRWVKIREKDNIPRAPWEPHPTNIDPYRYRVWYHDHWELMKQVTPDKAERMDAGQHPVGEVPVSILYARRSQEQRTAMIADSMLADLVNIDRSIFNQLSLVLEQVYLQCFNILMVPDDGTGGATLNIGAATAMTYNPQLGPAIMLAPDVAVIDVQWRLIENFLGWARNLAGVSRGRAEFSKEERSAATLTIESEEKQNQIASLAAAAEEFDLQLHRHVAKWEGLSEEQTPSVSYTRDVSIKALNDQIRDATNLATLAETVGADKSGLIELIKPIVTRAMQEHGLGNEALQRAMVKFEKVLPQIVEQVAA